MTRAYVTAGEVAKAYGVDPVRLVAFLKTRAHLLAFPGKRKGGEYLIAQSGVGKVIQLYTLYAGNLKARQTFDAEKAKFNNLEAGETDFVAPNGMTASEIAVRAIRAQRSEEIRRQRLEQEQAKLNEFMSGWAKASQLIGINLSGSGVDIETASPPPARKSRAKKPKPEAPSLPSGRRKLNLDD